MTPDAVLPTRSARVRRALVGLVALLSLSLTAATGLAAQNAIPDSAWRATQREAGLVLLLDVSRRAGDTLHVQLEAAQPVFDEMLRSRSWPVAVNTPRPREEIGRAVARAAWRGRLRNDREPSAVIVEIRSSEPADDPTRIRLVFRADALVEPSERTDG